MNRLKLAVTVETVIIAALLIIVAILFFRSPSVPTSNTISSPPSDLQFISPSIYAGILPPQSYLIVNYQPLQNQIQNYITENNLNVSLYVLNLRDGASFGIGEDDHFAPASLGKMFVAVVIMKKVEEGKISLNTILPINDSYRDSSSGELYAQPIMNLSVRDLMHWMLSDSDNTAARVLGDYVSGSDLQNLSLYLNYFNDYQDYDSNNLYTLTPKSTSNLFLSIYYSTILKPADSELILSDLTNTSFNIKQYADLPENITVAQKYGVIATTGDQQFHDCGIMYIQTRRVFYCVMTRNLDEQDASVTIGNIVNKIYVYSMTNTGNINL